MVYEESYASWQFQDSPQVGRANGPHADRNGAARQEPPQRRDVGASQRDRTGRRVQSGGRFAAADAASGRFANRAARQRPLRRHRQLHERSGDMEAGGRHRAVPDPQPEAVWNLRRHALEAERSRHDSRHQAANMARSAGPRRPTAIMRSRRNSAEPARSPRPTFTFFRPESPSTRVSSTSTDAATGARRRSTRSLAKGQTLDFVVGGRTPAGGDWYDAMGRQHDDCGSDRIRTTARRTILRPISRTRRTQTAAWSYGWLAAGALPDASTFKPYAKCEAEKYDVIGGLSNPGSDRWEDVLADTHYYPRVPHRELEIARLRTLAGNDHHQFLSEYGVGSAVDLPRFLRQCEQNGLAKRRQRKRNAGHGWPRSCTPGIS